MCIRDSGYIDRIAFSGTTVYFTLRGAKQLYSAVASNDPRTLLARSGDRVDFTLVPDAASPIPAVRDLRDEALSR